MGIPFYFKKISFDSAFLLLAHNPTVSSLAKRNLERGMLQGFTLLFAKQNYWWAEYLALSLQQFPLVWNLVPMRVGHFFIFVNDWQLQNKSINRHIFVAKHVVEKLRVVGNHKMTINLAMSIIS